MSCESNSNEEIRKKRKKGSVNPETYQRNIIKTARIRGAEYVNYKGKKVPQKTPPDEIKCKCSAKCFKLVTRNVLSEIWNSFYSMESKNVQDSYLQTLIERKEIQRRSKCQTTLPIEDHVEVILPDVDYDFLTIEDDTQYPFKRNHTFFYHLRIDGVFRRVCKNVFIKTHGVSSDRVRRLCSLLLQNQISEDRRGKNSSSNAICSEICVKIREHVKTEVNE